MKLAPVIFGVLLACVAALAQQENGPLMAYLQPNVQEIEPNTQLVQVLPENNRQKRSLLLGALGIGALGAGVLGAGVVGAGLLGAGAVGAGVIGAKAGFLGGALASNYYGRSYGGYGYGGGYGYHGGYGGRYGYGRSYGYGYPTTYIIEESW